MMTQATILPPLEERTTTSRAVTDSISPFFIVHDVTESIGFYTEKLGFEIRFKQPEDQPFFAILGRDGAQLFLKSERGIAPTPNPTRHASLRWDAFIHTANPDTLAAEFQAQGALFSQPLKNTHDGLRGFEITDPNGYVLFFGRPG